jgi:hypothetical protein
MNCRNVTEKIVESARHQIDLRSAEHGKQLREHTRRCTSCESRLEAEEFLTDRLKDLRDAAWSRRSSAASREMLMARFAERNRVVSISAGIRRRYWALAAAAAVLIGLFAIPRPHAAVQTASAEATDEISIEAPADPEAEGFIAVPYTPPLATGEMIRVVHTELNPAALASLGVNVDPAWTAQLPADLLLGEDGMPRAVRVVADTGSDVGGF